MTSSKWFRSTAAGLTQKLKNGPHQFYLKTRKPTRSEKHRGGLSSVRLGINNFEFTTRKKCFDVFGSFARSNRVSVDKVKISLGGQRNDRLDTFDAEDLHLE